MNGLLDGIAHLSFLGGGTFLPARTPYDRQMLLEHVGDRVRSKGRVQLLIDGRRWIVCRNDSGFGARCVRCNALIGTACCSIAGDAAINCVRCAVSDGVDLTVTHTAEIPFAGAAAHRQPSARSAR
jgi:hypothetical protein